MTKFAVYPLMSSDTGTYQTLSKMRDLVNQSKLHPWIRDRAAMITANCNRNYDCEDYAALGYTKNIIRFVRDPDGVEALHDPVTWYEQRIRNHIPVYGDCDDLSMYLASLLKAIGHNPQFRILGTPNSFYHVHVVCHGKMLDPSMTIGRLPRNSARSAIIDI
jgi:hypothetical protein